jgi:RNA polymerase sigma-70 factor (ECF subfamily)
MLASLGRSPVFEWARDDMDGSTQSREEQLVALVPAVRGWLYRLLGPGADFDDAVQDALVEVARALPRFEGRSKLTTYAHPIVLRSGYKAIARRKKRRQEQDDAVLERVPGVHDPEDQAHHRAQLERLHRVLDQLSEAQRGAFVLVNVERLSHEEAAEREDVSVETIRKRLTRGRSELARRLAADPELVAMLKGGGE